MSPLRGVSVSAVVLSLVCGLVVGLPPVVAAAADSDSGSGSGDVSVPVSPVVPAPVVVPQVPLWSAPAGPVWPSAGSATVDLSAAGVVSSFPDGSSGVQGVVSPGGLPVTVTVASSGLGEYEQQRLMRGLAVRAVPASVSALTVSTLDQLRVSGLGARGVVLSVANAGAPVDGAAPVRVSVGYGGFASAYGGGFADRLRLVRLPGCALTTPQVVACQRQTVVAGGVNDKTSATVSAVVDLGTQASSLWLSPASVSASVAEAGSQVVVLAVTAGSSSQQGDWGATPLSQAVSWSAGSSGGDFSYQVPVSVPPAPGGLVPRIALSYSSGSVDGLTESANTQASWVGEGWDYHPGYVERSYRPCVADGEVYEGADLCWVQGSPLSLVLDGTSTRLIKNNDQSDPLYAWKAEDDSAGWKVARFTDGANGATEWFKVTTRDGTQYFFGSKPMAAYGGVLQVEVYGNNENEPCYRPEGLMYSHCTMPYRWNLDRVVDVHGNVIDYLWGHFQGNYGGFGNSQVFTYDIYGQLSAIEYGANLNTAGARHTGRVEFSVANRCLHGEVACNPYYESNWDKWPDTPWDQHCQIWATSCPGQTTPTFWNIYRLTGIDTKVWDLAAGGWSPVASWQATQSFPATGDHIAPFGTDDSSPSLWLSHLSRPGFAHPIELVGWQEVNRVGWGGGIAPMTHYRVGWIRSGTGETIQVGYSGQDCTGGSLPGNAAENTRRCFPQNSSGSVSWWHKFVTLEVTSFDEAGGGPARRTHYDYSTFGASTAALWKWDFAWHTRPQYRTWSRWAGYPTVVTTQSASDGTGPRQVTENLYFRGMHGDKTGSGGWDRQATLDDGWDHAVVDELGLAGQVRRTFVYDGPVNAGRSNWTSAQVHQHQVTNTASFYMTPPNTPIYAMRVREVRTSTQEKLAGPTYRHTETLTSFEPAYGLPIKVQDKGDTTTGADDRCTLTDYTPAHTGLWLVGVARQTVTTDCAATPAAASVLAASRTTYDGLPYGAAPTRGLATLTQVAKQATAYPPAWSDFIPAGRATHDTFGRVVDSFDPLDRQTTTTYTPTTGGPVTQLTVTGASINGQRWDTVTSLDPKFAVPTRVVDVNSKTTQATYDAAGRLLKVWKDNRATSTTPDLQYAYVTAAPSAVSSKTLGPDGQQIESWQIFDGLLRPRQTQTLSASSSGRMITDTAYTGTGAVAKTSTFYNATAHEPAGGLCRQRRQGAAAVRLRQPRPANQRPAVDR